MAISLLVALVALALLHVMPQLARWRDYRWFRQWTTQLADTAGAGRVILAMLLPLALCLLLWVALGQLPLGRLLQPLFALVVLLYSFGPRELDVDLDTVLGAPDEPSREAAAQALAEDGEVLGWHAHDMSAAAAYAALRRRFGVLLWFFLLGPVGALGYRLAQMLGRGDSLWLDPDSRTAARYLANALDWLPAQLLTFTLAVVGHWEAVMGAWQRWHSQAATTSWYRSAPGFLGAAAQADVLVDTEAGDGYAEDRSDPLLELARLRGALLRALVTWLSVVALIVIGGWLS